MSKNKTGKRGLKIGKISSSHKGICVHTPSGKKIFIDENGKTKVIWSYLGFVKNKDLGGKIADEIY